MMLTAEQIPLTDRPLNKSNEVGMNLVEFHNPVWKLFLRQYLALGQIQVLQQALKLFQPYIFF